MHITRIKHMTLNLKQKALTNYATIYFCIIFYLINLNNTIHVQPTPCNINYFPGLTTIIHKLDSLT